MLHHRLDFSSNEPQRKCIHCNSVPIDKFLTFGKTKYGQNKIVSQMKEKDEQNIICNKCHNANFQRVTCYISHVWENYEKKKCVHLNLV